MEEPNNGLDDFENKLLNENKVPIKFKVILSILFIIIILLIGASKFIYILMNHKIRELQKKENEKEEKSDQKTKNNIY